jgi:hypothetical protein
LFGVEPILPTGKDRIPPVPIRSIFPLLLNQVCTNLKENRMVINVD